MMEITIAVLIVLIIVVASLIVGETKDNFSSPMHFGLIDYYSKVNDKWNFYSLWTVQKGTVIICKLATTKNYRLVIQNKVVVIDNDAKDFDLLDYLRKTASPDFNINDPDVYSMTATVVYIPSKENPDLADYPIFYLEENYKGIPIPGNTFANPDDQTVFVIPEFIKSCQLNRHARIVVKKLRSDPGITLTADSPKLAF